VSGLRREFRAQFDRGVKAAAVADVRVLKARARRLRQARARALRRQAAVCRARREALRARCATARGRLRARPELERAERRLADAHGHLQELRRSGMRAQRPAGAKVRQSESDDEVRQNLPPELRALFESSRGAFKATGRRSRTEAVLEYAEAHPDEPIAAAEREADRWVRRQIREYARPPAKAKAKSKRKRTGTDDVPF